MKKNFTHVSGIVLGLVLVFASISAGGELVNFIDLPSLVITIFGSFAALMVVFPMHVLKNTPRTVKLLLIDTSVNKLSLISNFTELSRKSRMNGLLALEDDIDKIDNGLLKLGIRMIVDGLEADVIKDTLELKLDTTQRRHEQGQEVFAQWGELAPAFGMLGTLIGLIIMLSGLDDASSIGSGMATALVTTFYGSLFANLIFLPISANLGIKTEEEMFTGTMIIEGILELQAGTNTRILEERLVTYLSPEERVKYKEISKDSQNDGVGAYE